MWTAWALLSWFMVDFVRTFGVDFPFYDEWEMIPSLLGSQRITLKWLWSQHNEHRIFLPRLLYLAVEKVARYDFRGGMFFDALALSASAAALIVIVRRIRGRTEYADAFFPFLMMNLGQAQSLVNSFQVAFIAGTLLMVAVLLLSAHERHLGFRSGVLLGICNVLLPLVGGHGVALVPALSICVVVTGWTYRNQPGGKWRTLVVWALAALGIALTAYYFVDYARPAKHPVSPGWRATLDAAIQFLTAGFGAAAKLGWPQTKTLFLAISGASVAALVWVFMNCPHERSRAIRLLLFLAALGSLALGIGWARIALSPVQLFVSRYAALAAPFWCGIYLVWELVDRVEIRRFVQTTLLVCAAVLAIPNQQDGVHEAPYYRDVRQVVVNDMRAGLPLGELMKRHYWRMYYGDRAELIEDLRLLHAKEIGVFKQLKE